MHPLLARRDALGLAAILLVAAALLAYRAWGVEPRAWASLCSFPGANPSLPNPVPPLAPFACRPRAVLVWMGLNQVWGAAAVVLGLMASMGRMPFWLAPLAVLAGVVAVINLNPAWGVAAVVLGLWSWITKRDAY